MNNTKRLQKSLGLLLVIISLVVLAFMLALPVDELRDNDITGLFFSTPLGLYLLFTPKCVLTL